MLVYYRRQVIAAGRGGQKALAAEDIYSLVEKMVASFRELGASGQIIGHGIYSWTGLRQPIPPELWPDLRFDFEANKASIDKFSYSHVIIDQDPTIYWALATYAFITSPSLFSRYLIAFSNQRRPRIAPIRA
jgi:hypothetical protein